jgi:hypothetical protein
MSNDLSQRVAKVQLSSPDTYDAKFKGKTSLHAIDIVPGSTVYRYDVTIEKKMQTGTKDLTKQGDS